MVVSFETIEHLADARSAVDEAARLLAPGGLYIVSTPNRLIAGIGAPAEINTHNRFHVREYALSELVDLLGPNFLIAETYVQVWMTGGMRLARAAYHGLQGVHLGQAARYAWGLLWRLTSPPREVLPTPLPPSYSERSGLQPMYFIIVAKRREW